MTQEAHAQPNWRRSAACTTNSCVEVAFVVGAIGIRDSKRSDSPVLSFTRDEWSAFVAGVKAGEFDLV